MSRLHSLCIRLQMKFIRVHLLSLCSTTAVLEQVTPVQVHSQQKMSVFVLEHPREVPRAPVGFLPVSELIALLSIPRWSSLCRFLSQEWIQLFE